MTALLYAPVLGLHGAWRWVVLAALCAACLGAIWKRGARSAARGAVVAVDIQLTLGLVLYLWVSPVTRAAMQTGFADGDARFFGLLHVGGMLLVVVAAHAAGILVKRDANWPAAWLFGAAFVLSAVATPWWRPLLRL